MGGDDPTLGSEWVDVLGGWLGDEPTRRTLRAIVDTQRRGLDAASRIVDRISEAVDSAARPAPTEADSTGADSLGRLRGDALRMIDQVGDLTARLLEASFDALAGAGSAGTETLRFDPAPAGGTTRVVVHLHGRGATAARPTVTRFETAGGRRIRRSCVRVEPVPAAVSGGSAAAVIVDVPADQPPGTYHALVLAGDDASLHLVLPVTDGTA